MSSAPTEPRAESDADVPTKEQSHLRFYNAFHAWFMSEDNGCDFWSECDAPEALATIAVEIADLERTAAEARAVARAVNTPEVIDFLGGVAQEAAHQRERWGDAHDRSKSAENWYWLIGYLAGKALRAQIEGDRGKAAHHTISSAAALYQWHTAIMTDESNGGLGVDADLNPEPIGDWLQRQIQEATDRMREWPDWLRRTAHMEGNGAENKTSAPSAEADAPSDRWAATTLRREQEEAANKEMFAAVERHVVEAGAEADAMERARGIMANIIYEAEQAFKTDKTYTRDGHIQCIGAAALLANGRAERERAYEEVAQWHEAQRPRLSGPDYGLANEAERAAMRADDRFHAECAKAIRSLSTPEKAG